MPHILEICLSPDLGGLELYAYKLSVYLSGRTNVTCAFNPEGRIVQDCDISAIKYIPVAKRSLGFTVFSAIKLATIIKKNKIDVLHVHWNKDLLAAVLARKLSSRSPRIVHSRHMHMTRKKNDFYHRFLYGNIYRIIAVTREVKNQLTNYIPDGVRPEINVSYIGVEQPPLISNHKKQEIKKAYGLDEPFVIGIFGRIEQAKGQHLVINAGVRLMANHEHIKLVVAGIPMSKQYLNELKALINPQYKKNIVFIGFVNKLHELMQVCDVIVLATDRETFGLVLVEAMRAKVCVLASNRGGPTEIIDHGKDGLLFEPGSKQDLYEKLKYLHGNAGEREKLAGAGYHKAAKLFDDKRQFEDVISLLKKW